jgi:hypothetical protein
MKNVNLEKKKKKTHKEKIFKPKKIKNNKKKIKLKIK